MTSTKRGNQARVVVVGSSNTDLVIRSPRLARPGETVRGEQFRVFAGGKGANQAVAAARFGAQVTLVAGIGRDEYGDAAVSRLRAEGINTRYVFRTRRTPSGVAMILVDSKGENSIGVAPGSNLELRAEHVDAAAAVIRRADCVVVQLEIPIAVVQRTVALACEHGVPVLLNPAPSRPFPVSLLKRVTFLTPNQSELGALTRRSTQRRSEIQTAARQLHSVGIPDVLVTCGSRGVCWCSDHGIRWFPAPVVQAVDTVGAGDCFSGTFAAAIGEGLALDEAIHCAIAAASVSVTRPGAQASFPRRIETLRSLPKCGRPRPLQRPHRRRHP
jgi:ribokinase